VRVFVVEMERGEQGLVQNLEKSELKVFTQKSRMNIRTVSKPRKGLGDVEAGEIGTSWQGQRSSLTNGGCALAGSHVTLRICVRHVDCRIISSIYHIATTSSPKVNKERSTGGNAPGTRSDIARKQTWSLQARLHTQRASNHRCGAEGLFD
jgi:hypothetical protein